MRVIGVIPARYGSSRLPGKPLKMLGSMTLLERVWRGVINSKELDRVVIATDHLAIEQEARRFGAETVMTDPHYVNGSERLAAALKLIGEEKTDIAVNIQGDMPFITGAIIDRAVTFLKSSFDSFSMVTIASPIFEEGMFHSPSDVKIVFDGEKKALYFSRAPIPCSRDGDREKDSNGKTVYGYKHYGLYVFKREKLSCYLNTPLSRLEEIEKLEQLRLLEQGHSIGVVIVSPSEMGANIEVDTEEDLIKAQKVLS